MGCDQALPTLNAIDKTVFSLYCSVQVSTLKPLNSTIERRTGGRALNVAAWLLLPLLSTLIGLVSLRYAVPNIPYPPPLSNFIDRRYFLIAHAVLASIALIVGPWQFVGRFRQRQLKLHRWLGRVYCVMVLSSWVASVPIALHAQTGVMASAGFLTLGVCWFATTLAGYLTIRRGRVREHQEWMIRSYALTAAAITLRVYLPASQMAHIAFVSAYPVVAWACWVPNLMFGEWLLGRSRAAIRQNSATQIRAAFL